MEVAAGFAEVDASDGFIVEVDASIGFIAEVNASLLFGFSLVVFIMCPFLLYDWVFPARKYLTLGEYLRANHSDYEPNQLFYYTYKFLGNSLTSVAVNQAVHGASLSQGALSV